MSHQDIAAAEYRVIVSGLNEETLKLMITKLELAAGALLETTQHIIRL